VRRRTDDRRGVGVTWASTTGEYCFKQRMAKSLQAPDAHLWRRGATLTRFATRDVLWRRLRLGGFRYRTKTESPVRCVGTLRWADRSRPARPAEARPKGDPVGLALVRDAAQPGSTTIR